MLTPDQPTVSVSAQAEREVPPDHFRLTGRVTGRGDTSQAAVAALVEHFAELERSVTAVPDSVEVRRSGVNSYEEDSSRLARWHAGRSLILDGSDPSTAAAVASALSAVAEVEVHGPEWWVSRDNPVHDELQTEVVYEARLRAHRYAAALGGTLGRLASLSDPGSGFDGSGMRRMAAAAATRGGGSPDLGDLDFTPPELTVSARVNATWYLVLPD